MKTAENFSRARPRSHPRPRAALRAHVLRGLGEAIERGKRAKNDLIARRSRGESQRQLDEAVTRVTEMTRLLDLLASVDDASERAGAG